MSQTQYQDLLPSITQMEVEKLANYKKIVIALHRKKKPHPGQVEIADALFNRNKKTLFVQCGRRFGKSEVAIYCAWRWAMFNPGSQIYIIAPQRKQAREVYWASGRLPFYGPDEFIEERLNGEMRLRFKNGSFIVVDGAENYEALRGITPDFVVYDEFKDHCKEFDVEVMQPATLTREAPLLIIGTPPKKPCYYTEKMDEVLNSIKAGDESYYYIQRSSYDNPYNSRKVLDKRKEILFARGDDIVWYVEYMGEYRLGGADAIFPMFSRSMILSHAQVLEEVRRDITSLRCGVAFDPGTHSCFAGLYGVYNPYTKDLYLLDEIYNRDQRTTSSKYVWTEHKKKIAEFGPYFRWSVVCDEAAAWFRNEIRASFRESVGRTRKHIHKKDNNISLIKDLLRMGKIKFSDRLEWLFWEIERYVRIVRKDGSTVLPDVDDHLIDCLTYLVALLNIQLVEDKSWEDDLSFDYAQRNRRDVFKTPLSNKVEEFEESYSDLPNYNYNSIQFGVGEEE